MTTTLMLVICLPVALALLAIGGLRVLGWGTLAIGFAGLLYSFGGNPGLVVLVIIPASAALTVSGIIALVIHHRQSVRRGGATDAPE